MKVLVVDDSVTMRRILINILKQIGIESVEEALNGQEAVDKVAAGGIDLVLLDWNMPVMTGIQALETIRGMGNSVPIFMVTTEAEKNRVLEAIKAGANNYIAKPFTPQKIMQKVQEFFGTTAAAE